MIRVPLVAIVALALMGADRPGSVDYRLSVVPEITGPPTLGVEVRLRGDADGETRIVLPQDPVSGLVVSGASASAPDTGHMLLRHRPGVKLSVRYRLRGDGPDAGRGASR